MAETETETGRWFSPGTLVSSTNITDRHDITEILLKVALNTINPNPIFVDNNRAPDKLRICVFYAMKTSKNACIIRSECTHYAYILLCKQTFQIRSVLVQSCT